MPSNRYYFDECSGNGSLGVLLSFGCVSMYIKPNVVLCGFCVVVLALQMAFFVAAAFAFAFLSFFMYFFHVFVFCVLFFFVCLFRLVSCAFSVCSTSTGGHSK